MTETCHRQTTAREYMRGLRLSVTEGVVPSPYYQRLIRDRRLTGRDKNISLSYMKAIIYSYAPGGSILDVNTIFYNDDGSFVEDASLTFGPSFSDIDDQASFQALVIAQVQSYASNHSYTVSDYIWGVPMVGAVPRSFANPSRSLNSAFQISTTRDAHVSYTGSTTNTLSLTGGTQGTDYLEYADDSGFTTNVVEVGRAVSSNTGSLTIGLNTSQISAWNLSGVIPAAKYVRVRSQNNTGTPTHTLAKAQEVLL